MEPTAVVDLVDEARKVLGDVGEGLVGHGVDSFDFSVFMKLSALALSYGLPRRPIEPTRHACRGPADRLARHIAPAVRVMKAAGRRPAVLDCGVQSGERQPDIDGSADGVADNATRPGVENHGDINEAHGDSDVSDVGDPELIGAVDDPVLGQIAEDRMVVVAARRRRGLWCKASMSARRHGREPEQIMQRARHSRFRAPGLL